MPSRGAGTSVGPGVGVGMGLEDGGAADGLALGPDAPVPVGLGSADGDAAVADGLSPAATPPGCGDPAATDGLADPTRIASPSPTAIAAMTNEETVAMRRLERLVRRGTCAWLRRSREGRRGLLMILAVTAKNGGA